METDLVPLGGVYQLRYRLLMFNAKILRDYETEKDLSL